MTLWDKYDAIVAEIAVTGITERGENINGWVEERRRIADALREQLIGSGTVSQQEHADATRRSAAPMSKPSNDLDSSPLPQTVEQAKERLLLATAAITT